MAERWTVTTRSLFVAAMVLAVGGSAFAADGPDIRGQMRDDIQAAIEAHVAAHRLNDRSVMSDAVRMTPWMASCCGWLSRSCTAAS
jgi:hypothetical protein